MDDLAVARFVLALRQTKAFDRVELKSSQEQGTGAGGRATGDGGGSSPASRDHPADGARPPAPRLRSYLVECGY